ncbi:SdrD B-like domain-containing protein [Alkanindiges illinoisensis]|nr:SdrD B-like domain-containing protein [Alkanindiges illinoisensis]
MLKNNVSDHAAKRITFVLAMLLMLISSTAQGVIQRSFVNLSFESVQISNGSPCRVYASQGASVPGWSTTHPSYSGTNRVLCPPGVNAGVDTTSVAPIIEVWKGPRDIDGGSGNCTANSENCISARSGSQFVELNAAALSEIRQQVCLESGETVGWKFSHNGRNTTDDKMRFKAGTQSIVQVSTSITGTGSVTSCDTGNCSTPLSARTTITGDSRWADYSGTFTSSSSANTYIGFESLNGSSTSGNFLDDIQVTLKPAVEFKLANYAQVENTSSSPTVEVQVVGIVPANINLNFSIDPTSTAVIGTDYKIYNGVSTSFNIPLAAGDYSSGHTISIPVELLNNSVVEGSRFFKVILTPDATKFTIMPTNFCTNTGGNATSTYSIQDDDIGLQLEKTWVNASVNDRATLTTTGGATGAANINYVSTATAANVANTSNTIIMAAGASRTLAETLSSSNTGAYSASNWSCNGGSLSGSVLTTSSADYGKVIKCNVTNTRTTSLQLAKTWGANSVTTDNATIGATTGGTNNTTAFTTPGGTNASSGAPVAVAVGNTITFPAETGTNIANYNTVLSCTANGGPTVNALSGTNGQASNTLVIAAGDAGKSIVCTYNNTRKSTTFRLAKAWAANSLTGNVANIGATTGLTNNTAAFTSTASTATNGAAVTVYAGETATLPAETMSSGTLANYTTAINCNAGILSGNNGHSVGNTLTITAAATATSPITCTYTNTRKSASLTLQKIWANAKLNDAATITATGLTSLSAVANTASETDAAAGQTVYAGDSITLGETFTTGSATNYNATLACTGNATALTGTTLTVNPADTAITCTYTNARRAATLTLSKIWSSGSIAGDTATVSSSGFGNNATSGTSTATAAGNTTTGTSVTVYAGETGTISETFGTGTASNYNATLACSGNSTALSGNTLTINPADTAISCSYTNTVAGTDLAIDKTGTSSVTQGNTVSYSIKVWNKGPGVASSSTFTDTVPGALTNVSWSCSASGSAVCGTASGSGNTINVTTGTLPVNASSTAPTSGSYLTFTVSGAASTSGNITNTANIAVTSGTDPVSSNNSSSASTTISTPSAITPDTPQKEARFVITPDLPTIYRGQAGTQLINITNQGPDDASGTVAVFKPRTQTGVTVTSVKIVNGANCSLSSGEWSCPVGSVANGGSFQLQVGYDTTASSTLGTAIQADIRVGSNEFNPGSGVGESLYNVWGSTNPNGSSQFNEIRPNGAFALGYGTANANENVNLSTAWLPTQVNPTGAYLTQAAIGGNNSVFGPSGTYSPMISRIITSLNTDTAKSQTLLALNPATQAGDNRRVWQLTTGIYVPATSTASLCIGNAGSQLDDGAYIMLNGAQVGVDGKWSSNPYIQNSVTLNTGYNRITYRIANRNTPGSNEDYAQGLYGEIGLSLNGEACTAANLDATARLQIPASINIVEKQVVSISGQVFEDNSGSTAVNSNAYNGIKDAGELGIANSIVTINNCTNTTAIATTKTDANGDYRFSLSPTDLPAGNFCIAQTNLTGYSSVSGTTGYNRTSDTITISNTGAASYSNHNFGDARLTALLSEDGQQTITAGGVADYPHRLTAQSVLTISSLNQTVSQQPANSSDQNWQAVVYRDSNCNGKVDSGEGLFSQSLPLSLKNAEEVCLVQRVYAPATASMGAQHLGQLQASYNVTLADSSQITGTTLQRQDTTLLGSAGLTMQKGVRSVASCPSTATDTGSFGVQNQVQNGGYLEYEITYRNNTTKNLIDVIIKDSVPTGTVYKTASCTSTPSGSCNPSHTNGALLWQTGGSLLPNQQGKVRFCVQVP